MFHKQVTNNNYSDSKSWIEHINYETFHITVKKTVQNNYDFQ